MLTLLLVRHGETAWNAERRLQGATDVPLSDTGRAQARALAPAVAGYAPDVVVCSPLSRTVETARLLGHDPQTAQPLSRDPQLVAAPVQNGTGSADATQDSIGTVGTDARWAEADLGRWAGRYAAELRAEGPDYDAWRAGTFRPPGGEGLDELAARVLDGLAALRERTGDGGTALVVTHGGPVRAVLRHVIGLQPAHLVPVAPGGLTVLQLDGERARLAAYNIVPLTGPPAEVPD